MSDPRAFRADLDAVPERLAELAHTISNGPARWSLPFPPRRLLLVGMGSSGYAAQVAALRLRSLGLDAVAELSSVQRSWPPDPELVVVAISASGRSTETLRFAERHRGTSHVVALTNEPGSPLAELCDATVELLAGPEVGGVACRSYRHTLAALAELERSLGGDVDPVLALRRAAAASAHLLDRAEVWLPSVLAALAAGDGTWLLAPVERIGSALQGALMLREGPRRLATGCETGDWSHVDVYLTKTLEYRAVVFAGSPWDAAALAWMRERARPFVSVGADVEGAAATVRYPHDDDPLVAALTEVLVAELVAHAWWAQ